MDQIFSEKLFKTVPIGRLLSCFCPCRTSHVGGGPFTYVSMRWKLKGTTALCRCATPFQHKHASSSRNAARRRKRRTGETKDTWASPLEDTLWTQKKN